AAGGAAENPPAGHETWWPPAHPAPVPHPARGWSWAARPSLPRTLEPAVPVVRSAQAIVIRGPDQRKARVKTARDDVLRGQPVAGPAGLLLAGRPGRASTGTASPPRHLSQLLSRWVGRTREPERPRWPRRCGGTGAGRGRSPGGCGRRPGWRGWPQRAEVAAKRVVERVHER